MCKILCITNRALCREDFVYRVNEILDLGIPVILREKDLSPDEYYKLLCQINRKDIIAHTFANEALRFGCRAIHLPLALLGSADISQFSVIGASTHSVSEAQRAQKLGAAYITAGHVFATDCKRGVPPRGTQLLSDIKNSVGIPIYALGGINAENASKAVAAGADGIAVMSGFMQCGSVKEYLKNFTFISNGGQTA